MYFFKNYYKINDIPMIIYIYHRHSVAKQSVRFLKCDAILKLRFYIKVKCCLF